MTKIIRCSQKDLSTGTSHHFLVQKNKNRGAWVSSLSIELSPFMVWRSERREKRQEVFCEKLRVKAMARAQAQEAARQQAAVMAAVRHKALLEQQAAARATAAEAKQRSMMEKAQAKAAAKAAKEAEKLRAKAERDAVRAAQKAAKANSSRGAPLPLAHQNSGDSMESNAQRLLFAHKSATQKLIRKSSEAGLSQVPEAEMQQVRMHTAGQLQACFAGFQIKRETIFDQIGKAEQAALAAETAAKKASIDKGLQNVAGGSNNAQQWSQQAQQQNLALQHATANNMSVAHQPQLHNSGQRSVAMNNSGPMASSGQIAMNHQPALHHRVHSSSNPAPTPMQQAQMQFSASQNPTSHASVSAGHYSAGSGQYSPNSISFGQSQNLNQHTGSALRNYGTSSQQNAHAQASSGTIVNANGIEWSADSSALQSQLLQAMQGTVMEL